MPPKKAVQKARAPAYLTVSWKAFLGPEGEFRELSLPLTQAEIDADLQQLYEAANAAAMGKRRLSLAVGAGAAQQQQQQGGASSEELSPGSVAAEDENESGNPAAQPAWGQAGAKGAAAGAKAALGAAAQQQQPGMA